MSNLIEGAGSRPSRLTISLWDFCWYTMTAPGEPFEDLGRAFMEAVERGYNTVRICGLPLTLFGDHVPSERELQVENMGGAFGQRTREGPVGKEIAEYATQVCRELGFWGSVLSSNCAPHHPFWRDVEWQRSLNERMRSPQPVS